MFVFCWLEHVETSSHWVYARCEHLQAAEALSLRRKICGSQMLPFRVMFSYTRSGEVQSLRLQDRSPIKICDYRQNRHTHIRQLDNRETTKGNPGKVLRRILRWILSTGNRGDSFPFAAAGQAMPREPQAARGILAEEEGGQGPRHPRDPHAPPQRKAGLCSRRRPKRWQCPRNMFDFHFDCLVGSKEAGRQAGRQAGKAGRGKHSKPARQAHPRPALYTYMQSTPFANPEPFLRHETLLYIDSTLNPPLNRTFSKMHQLGPNPPETSPKAPRSS